MAIKNLFLRKLAILGAWTFLASSAYCADKPLVLDSFGGWAKTGSLDLEKKNDLTVIDGRHMGGELSRTFSTASLSQYKYIAVDRAKEQGGWGLAIDDGKTKKKLSPLESGMKIMNYDISGYINSNTPFKLSINVFPGAELTLKNIMFTAKPVSSEKYELDVYKGAKRYFDTPEGRFEIPSIYEDITPPLKKSDAVFTEKEKEQGLIWYKLDDHEMINPGLVPERKEIGRPLSLFACPGQYEGASFSLYALESQGSLFAECQGLESENDGKIPASGIEIRRIFCWPQRIHFAKTQFKMVPELLLKQDKAPLQKGKSRSYWINLRAPENAKPGIYKGYVKISSSNRELCQIPLRLRIIGLKLLSNPEKTFGIYYGNSDREFDVLAKYGFQSVLNGHQHAMKGLLEPMKKIAAEEKAVNKRLELLYGGKELPQLDFSGFEKYVEKWRKAGFKGPMTVWFLANFAGSSRKKMSIASFLNIPMSQNASLKEYPSKLTPEFKKLFMDCIKAINKKAGELGIEIYFYTFDEVGCHPDKEGDKYVIEIFKLIKEAGGKTLLTCGADEFTNKISPWLDVRQYAGSATENKKKRDAAYKSCMDAGAKFYRYGGCTEEKFWYNRYSLGFENWICGFDGQFPWNLHSKRNNPFNDFDHKNKDAIILYETSSHELLPTLQLEALRQGIDDSRYIYTLEALIKKGLKSGDAKTVEFSKDAEKELDNIKRSIPFRKDFLKQENWDFRNFDRYRWRIACLALELQNMLEGQKKTKSPDPGNKEFIPQAKTEIKVNYKKRASQDAMKNMVKQIIKPELIPAPPEIDGKLKEPFWASSKALTGFKTVSGGQPEMKTRAWICRSGDALYFAFRCEEPEIKKMLKAKKDRDDYVWRDDCVEIFIDGNHNHSSFCQILVNPVGTVADLECINGKANLKWNCKGLKAASYIGDDFWSVEIAAPIASFKEKNICVAGINLQRTRQVIYSSCSLFPDSHKPVNYGDLIISETPFDVKGILVESPLLLGDNELKIELEKIKNDASVKLNAKAAEDNLRPELKYKTQAKYSFKVKSPGKLRLEIDAQAKGCPPYESSFNFDVPEGFLFKSFIPYVFKNEKETKLQVVLNFRKRKGENLTFNAKLLDAKAKKAIAESKSEIMGNESEIIIPLGNLMSGKKYKIQVSVMDGERIAYSGEKDFLIMNY